MRSVPALDLLLKGKSGIHQLEDIDIDDLLGRESVSNDISLLEECIEGKTILVTGAGGSIGSEICRQVVYHGAKHVIMLDSSEFNLYQIDKELNETHITSSLLGSILNIDFLKSVFESYNIDTIYHAAAYKHVPLVESNVIAGTINNVVGTFNLS